MSSIFTLCFIVVTLWLTKIRKYVNISTWDLPSFFFLLFFHFFFGDMKEVWLLLVMASTNHVKRFGTRSLGFLEDFLKNFNLVVLRRSPIKYRQRNFYLMRLSIKIMIIIIISLNWKLASRFHAFLSVEVSIFGP